MLLTLSKKTIKFFICLTSAALVCAGCQQSGQQASTRSARPVVSVTPVVAHPLNKQLSLTAEILPYQWVALYPKVEGFIQKIYVDRGYKVKTGEVLVQMVAPELVAQEQEAAAKVLEAKSGLTQAMHEVDRAKAEKAEAEAKYQANLATARRYEEAAKTPGTIAPNDVQIQQANVQIDLATVNSRKQLVSSSQAAVLVAQHKLQAAIEKQQHLKDLEAYLTIRAPFDGIITERNMHEGALAYPPSGAQGYKPMLRLDELSLLRVVVAVPQIAVSKIAIGTPVSFTVPPYPNRFFVGTVARVAHSLDEKTRTMAVELNYPNPDWVLSPGTFAEVRWPMTRPYPTMFVPATAIVTSLEKPFVIRVRNGIAQWVTVSRGETQGDDVEVFGEIAPNDLVVVNASSNITNGAAVEPKLVNAKLVVNH